MGRNAGQGQLFDVVCIAGSKLTQLRNWFKGQDTVSLLAYLEKKLENYRDMECLDAETRPLVKNIFLAIRAGNRFMRCMYHGALWLSNSERATLLKEGHGCLKAWTACADMSYSMGLARFKFQPKFHMMGEFLYRLEDEQTRRVRSLNPLAFSTQLDEDFVGQIAHQSRLVSVRTVHTRTLSRYQIALALRW